MAGVIKNLSDILTQISDAIKIGGTPSKINATDHKQTLEDLAESVQLRLQTVVTDDLADDSVDWKAAGSRGIHLFPLVDNNFEINSFTNPVKGDSIYLAIYNDFAFDFSSAFKAANTIMGIYIQKSSGVNFVRVTCLNDDASSEHYLVEYLNNSQGSGEVITFVDENDVESEKILKTKVIEIGTWDMNTDTQKTRAHGITNGATKIVYVQVSILDEVPSNGTFPLNHNSIGGTDNARAGHIEWDNTNIIMDRRTGGLFDGTSYDSAANRGIIIIKYFD